MARNCYVDVLKLAALLVLMSMQVADFLQDSRLL
jgi:hypothetical protein